MPTHQKKKAITFRIQSNITERVHVHFYLRLRDDSVEKCETIDKLRSFVQKRVINIPPRRKYTREQLIRGGGGCNLNNALSLFQKLVSQQTCNYFARRAEMLLKVSLIKIFRNNGPLSLRPLLSICECFLRARQV